MSQSFLLKSMILNLNAVCFLGSFLYMLICATSSVSRLGTVKHLRLNVFVVTEMTEKHFDIHEI
jgi:hypothetical protein